MILFQASNGGLTDLSFRAGRQGASMGASTVCPSLAAAKADASRSDDRCASLLTRSTRYSVWLTRRRFSSQLMPDLFSCAVWLASVLSESESEKCEKL
jgi:hypothetical protein